MNSKFFTESARITSAYESMVNESYYSAGAIRNLKRDKERVKKLSDERRAKNTMDVLDIDQFKYPNSSKFIIDKNAENNAPDFRPEDHPEGEAFFHGEDDDITRDVTVPTHNQSSDSAQKQFSLPHLSKDENDASLFNEEDHEQGAAFLHGEDHDTTNESTEDSAENKFYVIADYGKGWKIQAGFEFKEDAIEFTKPGECPRTKNCKIKIVARVTLKKFGIDALNDDDWQKGIPEGAIKIDEALPAVAALPAAEVAGHAIIWTAAAIASFLASHGAPQALIDMADTFANKLNGMGMKYTEGREWLLSKIPTSNYKPYTADEEASMMANSHLNTPTAISKYFDDPKYAPTSDGNYDDDDEGDGKIKKAVKGFVKNAFPKTKKELFIDTPYKMLQAEVVKQGGDVVGDGLKKLGSITGNDTIYRIGSGVKGAGNAIAFGISPNNIFGKGAIIGLGPTLGTGALLFGQKIKDDGLYHPLFGQTGRYIRDGFKEAEEALSTQPEDNTELNNKFKKNFGL